MMNQIKILLLLVVATTAFVTPRVAHKNGNTALYNVIQAGEDDFKVDPNSGGVGLAKESVIKITGDVKHKPGSADPKPSELLRYTKLSEVPESKVMSAVKSIVCTGRGAELYKDPKETTIKEITYAPLDAVRDAMNSCGSTQDAEKIVINFLGGDDLQIMEVMNAVEQLVLNLDVKTNAKISFNSICHESFPLERAFLTVVALGSEGADASLSGAEKAIAEGEVYFQDGTWYTLAKEDINTAVA